MIPAWKARREADRLKVQIQGWLSELTAPVMRARHDRTRADLIRCNEGRQPVTAKIAILLIFQPQGVPPSLHRTIAHLDACGYAVLAVCNMPLSASDLDRLTDSCWRIVERPNLGYDFGGYRDALWVLDGLGVAPETLILMNDSVWFPIREGDGMIAGMEADDAVFSGAQVFRPSDRKAGTGVRMPMFGSYFLFLKRPAIEAPAFRAFWRAYKMSSNKELTLRRGERAFSHKMMAAGLPSAGAFSQERFGKMVAALDAGGLDLGLRSLICLDAGLEQERQGLLAAADRTAQWSDAARGVILKAAASKNYIGSSPVLSIRDLGFPMIKKNNEILYTRARQAIVAALDAGDLDGFDPVIEAELRARVAMGQG